MHLSKICELSPHQTAFLRIAFSSAKPPQWPDPKTFRENTIRILTGRRAPTILFDELMYARAWNSYVGDLGEQAAALLGKEKHPIEAFFEYQDAIGADPAETMTRVRRAIRTFWRFSARYCESWEYCELIKRLRTKIGFDDAWMELASSKDQSAIDIAGVAELFLPSTGASFSIIESLVVYPPLYAIFMFVPTDEAAREQMEDLEARGDPKVIFDPVALSF